MSFKEFLNEATIDTLDVGQAISKHVSKVNPNNKGNKTIIQIVKKSKDGMPTLISLGYVKYKGEIISTKQHNDLLDKFYSDGTADDEYSNFSHTTVQFKAGARGWTVTDLSLIHISEPTRRS